MTLQPINSQTDRAEIKNAKDDKEDAQPKHRLIEVRAIQHDSTAGIFYSKGLFVLHLSLFIAYFIIDQPDLEYGRALNLRTEAGTDAILQNSLNMIEDCEVFGEQVRWQLIFGQVTHFLCALLCYLCEFHETAIGLFGNFVRLGDTLAVFLNVSLNFLGMTIIFRYFGYQKYHNL